MRLLAGTAIDIGQRREENQDHLYSWTDGAAGLYIIADGMGGQRAGGLASELAIATLEAELLPLVEEVARATNTVAAASAETVPVEVQSGDSAGQSDALSDEDDAVVVHTGGEAPVVAPLFTSLMDNVGAAIDKTNEVILRHASEHRETAGLGSTVTLAIVSGSLAVVANLGDSRTYLVREGEITRLTQDHSLVATYIAMGYISDDEAYTHPQRNLIYRNLGGDADAQPDISVHRLHEGDTLLLCSDGLWDMVRDNAILAVVREHAAGDPQRAAERLTELANENGGEDNISVIVVTLRDN